MNDMIKIKKNISENTERSLYRQIYDNFAFRLEIVYANKSKFSENEIDYANNLDYFQYHYARYLCGMCKSGHRSFEEFRGLINAPLFKEEHFNILISEIEEYLLDREMYESLSLFVRTNKKFKQLINKMKKEN